MRSRKVCFRIPWPLFDALDHYCKDLGYKSVSRMLVATCLLVVQNERRRIWVKEIANANANTQSYLIEQMLKFPLDLESSLKALRKLDDD